MIKFFRKIRYDLMGKNKTGKYFKYAIGEIVLVVIGILIALSINNWNEDQIRQREEVFYLEKLYQNFKQDTLQLNGNIAQLKNRVEILKMLASDINNKQKDSFNITLVNSLMFTSGFISETATWDNLQSSGKINILKNQAILDSLYLYHNFNETYIRAWMESDQTYSRQNFGPFLFRAFDLNYGLPPNLELYFDPINCRTNRLEKYEDQVHLRNALRHKNNACLAIVSLYELQKNRAGNILKLINEELESNR